MGMSSDLDKLISKLDNIEKKAKRDIAKNGLNKGADIIKESVIEKAPEDTGKLKSSIDKGKYIGGQNASIQVGIFNGDEDVKRYAFYQNNGTERMVGKKFFNRGATQSKKEAVEVMKDTILTELGLK